MIYLDNSATTFPKPNDVILSVERAMRRYSFNPGRGGYRSSLETAKAVYEARESAAQLFGIDKPENVIFTPGCTQALNMVFKGVLKQGDHVVISSFEHNAVLRPIQKLSDMGLITYSAAEVVPYDHDATIENFRKNINDHTRLMVCTHASNVFGIRLPVERLCALAHSYQIPFCLDAAQSAGVLDLNIARDQYDFVCCAGHKALYGPMGVGVLLINCNIQLDTVLEGGTGSESADPKMPEYYPDRLESGTLNIPGIIGLKHGIDFVQKNGTDNIMSEEMKLIRRLYRLLDQQDNIELYTAYPDPIYCVPVLSFSVTGIDSEEVSAYLGSKGIATRAGLHCAPLAHRTIGTSDRGTVRISPSFFTKRSDIEALVYNLKKFRH